MTDLDRSVASAQIWNKSSFSVSDHRVNLHES
jgi:hypothetical protein